MQRRLIVHKSFVTNIDIAVWTSELQCIKISQKNIIVRIVLFLDGKIYNKLNQNVLTILRCNKVL